MYWQIRFEPNTAGAADRIEVGYKDFATYSSAPGPDPLWNMNNSLVTTLWRDPVVNMPENGLIGVMFEQQEDNDYAYVVTNASNWIYAGTGFVDGTKIPGIVGYEYDKVWNNGFSRLMRRCSPIHLCMDVVEVAARLPIQLSIQPPVVRECLRLALFSGVGVLQLCSGQYLHQCGHSKNHRQYSQQFHFLYICPNVRCNLECR